MKTKQQTLYRAVGNHLPITLKGMTEKEIIKYLEIVFNDITDFDLVSVNNPITKVLKHETKDEREKFFSVVDNVKLFAKKNDLIEKHGTGDFFKLTDKGIRFKKSNSSYKIFLFKEKLKSINLKKLGIIVTAIGIILKIVWRCEDNQKVEFPNNESEILEDSLTYKLYNKNQNINKSLLDTLETKKESD